MHYRDANRPEYAGDPRPVEREPGASAGTGNAAVDGYTTVARVPVLPRAATAYGMGWYPPGSREEMVPVARAERIEAMFADMPAPLSPDEY